MLLALVLCLGLLPAAAVAAETFTQVTSQEQFTTGQYYMLTDTGYAPRHAGRHLGERRRGS